MKRDKIRIYNQDRAEHLSEGHHRNLDANATEGTYIAISVHIASFF